MRRQRLLIYAVLALGLLVSRWMKQSDESESPANQPAVEVSVGGEEGAVRIARAFADKESDLWVQASGIVERVMSDDNEGSRHQRFIVRLSADQTILISHNIDLAPRVSGLSRGDTVRFRGEYEWNERGGVVHWTHHDPKKRREGGWIEHEGERYH